MLRTVLPLFLLVAGFPASASNPTILVLGDSLSIGYGLRAEESWVRLLQEKLKDQGYEYRVVNSSISGDTTQGGLTRLPKALEKYRPALVIIELGGNDGLRGIPLDTIRANMDAMIRKSLSAGAQVLLAGMRIPPNYGPNYSEKFHSIYGELAAEHDIFLLPFFLDGVALNEGLMQPDGIHPNGDAQPVLMQNVWRTLCPEWPEPPACTPAQ